ncbi:MAG: response regulator transcription factor [Chloroflexi bacterium]|nr:MAG: response regulator transcription factor [Chloroflexota bacterium]
MELCLASSLAMRIVREKQPRSFSTRLVLIVEEHPDIVDMLQWTLKLEGYESIVAQGQDWIDQMIISGNNFFAILLDLSKEAWLNRAIIIQQLEQRWSSLHPGKPPLVVLTTFVNTDKYTHGYPLVHKPFHISDLRAKVKLAAAYFSEETVDL